jgi:hypothetical protein
MASGGQVRSDSLMTEDGRLRSRRLDSLIGEVNDKRLRPPVQDVRDELKTVWASARSPVERHPLDYADTWTRLAEVQRAEAERGDAAAQRALDRIAQLSMDSPP